MLNYYIKTISNDYFESVINITWKNTGISGFPEAEIVGNILRKSTSCRLSIRIYQKKKPKK